jgi:hypothetical protein
VTIPFAKRSERKLLARPICSSRPYWTPIKTAAELRLHLMTEHPTPRAMNRQVGPSIVLSVLIVCFFAVALFQRDPPRGARGSRRGASGEHSTARRDPTSGRDGPIRAISSNLAQDDSVSRPDTRPSARSESPRLPSERSAREPDGEYTVVKPNETLGDVALRVYGTSQALDPLWRANRDSLPRRDSSLSRGAVLRTPSLR